MRSRIAIYVCALALIVAGVPAHAVPTAEAHQPYCEDSDLGPRTPFIVKDPTVSTAFYGTLFPEDDVDYFTFHAEKGQRILLGMTIPQIDGQEEFAPAFVVFGPGLGRGDAELLPAALVLPRERGFEVVPAGDDSPTPFFEPFSRTSYWSRQEIYLTIPASGRFTVGVWDPDQEYGRYVMVIGDREAIGGEIDCLMSLKDFFTPVDPVLERDRQPLQSDESEAGQYPQNHIGEQKHGVHTH